MIHMNIYTMVLGIVIVWEISSWIKICLFRKMEDTRINSVSRGVSRTSRELPWLRLHEIFRKRNLTRRKR